MAIEETLLIKLIIDIQQSVTSINNLEKQFAGLKSTIQTTFGIAANDLSNLAKEEAKTAAATAVLNEQIKKQKAAFDATKFPEGSYRQLNAQLKDLNNRYKELSATERNSPIGVALSKNIVQVKNNLKRIDADLGDFQRNVGNYAGGLRGLFGNLNKSLQSIGLAGKIRSIPQIFGAISSAVDFAFKAIDGYNKAYSATSVINDAVKNSSTGLVTEFIKEKSTLNNLRDAVKDESLSKKDREAAIEALKVQFPEYFKNLTLENSKTGELESSYTRATTALIENSKAKIKAAVQEELITKAVFAQLDATAAQNERERLDALNAENQGSISGFFSNFSVELQRGYLEVTNFFTDATAETAKAAAIDTKTATEAVDEIFKSIIPTIDEVTSSTSLTSKEIENLGTKAAKTQTVIEALNSRKGDLEGQIKNLIATNKSFSKQQDELGKITAKLVDVEKQYAEATRFAETNLARLTRRQGELNAEIQTAIADGKPYDAQLNELIDTTKGLTDINKEFANVQAKVSKALQEFADGSLADYDQRIADLSKEQKNLNITSQEYADNQAAITDVEKQRDIILKALAVDLDAVAVAQADLDNQLSDQELQNAAFERAKARIAGVKDATQAGAAEIEKIQKDLDAELKAIEGSSLQRKLSGINAEISALELQKQKELSVVGDNQKLKGSIEASYQQKKTDLELQGAVTRGQILQGEVDANKDANAQLLEDDTKTAQQRKDLEMQVADAIAQGAQMVFQIITNLQQQATEKQLATLESERQTQLDRAEAFGASEAVKLRIEKEFDAKKAEIEKKAAERAKAIALGQAAVDIALSILKASASAPPPLNIPAIVLASVLGAIQLAVIASQKFALGDIFDFDIRSNGKLFAAGHSGNGKIGSSTNNHFAKGAYLKNGAYHSEGGMPIINPYSGQKVAEIEKGEAIINRKNTSLFYDELSYINSFKGRGISFPNAGNIADYEGLKNSLKQKGIAYGLGGTYGQFNPNMLKLQNGAIVAADIARQENGKFANNNIQSQLLQTVINNLNVINRTLIEGFGSIPSTAQELQQAAQILKDAENAS